MVKKIAKITLYVLLIFILLFIIVNILPTKRPDALFTEAELNARGSLSPENGIFILLGFYEPSNKDPQSKEIVEQYCNFVLNKDNIAEYQFRDRQREGIREITRFSYIYPSIDDWNFFKKILRDKELIKKDNANKFLFDRIERLVNSRIVEDISRPDRLPILHLSLGFWMEHYVIIHNIRAFIEGIEKDWLIAAQKMLNAVDFGQKLSRSARNYWSFYDGNHISADALYFLSEILNRSPYNTNLYKLVIRRLMNLRKFNNGLKYDLMSFYFECLRHIDIEHPELPKELDRGILKYFNASVFYLTFDANRTIREFNEYFRQVLNDMQTPPYKRSEKAELIKNKNFFWWFINYAGRLYSANEIYDFYSFIDRYYLYYARNDLVIILAMLHNGRVQYDKVQPYLEGLVKKGFIDPFTGKAYIWDEKDKMIRTKGSGRKVIHRNSSDIHYYIMK